MVVSGRAGMGQQKGQKPYCHVGVHSQPNRVMHFVHIVYDDGGDYFLPLQFIAIKSISV